MFKCCEKLPPLRFPLPPPPLPSRQRCFQETFPKNVMSCSCWMASAWIQSNYIISEHFRWNFTLHNTLIKTTHYWTIMQEKLLTVLHSVSVLLRMKTATSAGSTNNERHFMNWICDRTKCEYCLKKRRIPGENRN